ncbi:hypothetical protein MAH4_26140 [Sessilibacter sp. MAH4]
MYTKNVIHILSALILIVFSVKGLAMSFFGSSSSDKNKEEIIIFGGMEGQLLFEGKPAAGAEVKLWTKWDSSDGDTVVVTSDENGHFQFEEQKGTYKSSAFTQLVINQQITATYQGDEYLIWNFSSLKVFNEGALGYNPKNLMCELTNDREYYEEGAISLFTSCSWDN